MGAFVIGNYSDRVGRRPAMMLCFLLIGFAIVGMALIPTYAQIGIAAPILAVIARMLQGFSLGGEIGSNTAFLLEAAPIEKRGLIAVAVPFGLWLRTNLPETLHAPERVASVTVPEKSRLHQAYTHWRIMALGLVILASGCQLHLCLPCHVCAGYVAYGGSRRLHRRDNRVRAGNSRRSARRLAL